MPEGSKAQKVLVVGAGPVGALAALYAANRGDDVHVYELRAGENLFFPTYLMFQNLSSNLAFSLVSFLEEDHALLYQRQKIGLSTSTLSIR